MSSGGVDHAGAGHAGTRAKSPTSGTTSDDDELFEDARDDNDIYFHIPVPPTHRRTSSEESQAFKYVVFIIITFFYEFSICNWYFRKKNVFAIKIVFLLPKLF